MKVKLSSTAAIILMLLSSVIFAQRNFSIENQVANLNERLNLSAEQTVKITKILTEFKDDMKTQRSNFSGDRSAIRDVMLKIIEVKDLKILKTLNKVQKKEYKKIISERSSRFNKGSRRGNGIKRGNRNF